jgi:DNA-dependent RNA polymerase auxiliary subunit epsilon
MNIHQSYIDLKRINIAKKSFKGNEYSLACYTKKMFYSFDWDNTTIKNRGIIYDQEGNQINRPFEKIFNLDETPNTETTVINELMASGESYEILDKVNGHLIIVSYDIKNDVLFMTTKGSFDHEFAEAVKEWSFKDNNVEKRIRHAKYNITFLFEVLAEYDKHLMYEKQIEQYSFGKPNVMVLLGAINNETGESYNHSELESFGFEFSVPTVKRFHFLEESVKDVSTLLDKTGIEGYIIHFPHIGFRVKVKTREYIKLRYQKKLQPENLVKTFVKSGFQGLYRKLDEEIYPLIEALEEDFLDFLEKEHLLKDSFSYCSHKINFRKEFLQKNDYRKNVNLAFDKLFIQ